VSSRSSESFRIGDYQDHLLTTNHVIAEAITLTLKIGHDKAVKLGDQLYGEKLARIHWAASDEERAAFEYLKRHQDQTYSMVDCLSFIVMEKLGIREALAVDSDFTHRFIVRGPGHCEGCEGPSPQTSALSEGVHEDVRTAW
jgi:predicted nucleic acid-binding protein